jgi:hypothetical protein
MVGKSKYLRSGQASKRSKSSVQTDQIDNAKSSLIPERDLLDVLIALAVRGGPSPFPVDPNPAFEWKGDFESTFEAGDKQILLWAIDDCAQRRATIPDWVAQKLYDILFHGVARGEFASWEDAFGPIRVKQQRTIQAIRNMVAVWEAVNELKQKNNQLDYDGLFEEIRQKFPIGIVKLKKYYQDMQRFMEEHGQDLQKFMQEHPAYGFDRRMCP